MAFTSEETSCFFARAGQERLPDLLDVLMDMYLNSKFTPIDVRKEREVIKEEWPCTGINPRTMCMSLLNAAQWPINLWAPNHWHRGKPGSPDRACLRQYHQSHYVASNTTIAAAGQVEQWDFSQPCQPLRSRIPSRRSVRLQAAHNPRTRPFLCLHPRYRANAVAWAFAPAHDTIIAAMPCACLTRS